MKIHDYQISRGYMKIQVLDSFSTITILNDVCVATHPCKTLVEDIRQIHK